jgi:polyphosphate kinase
MEPVKQYFSEKVAAHLQPVFLRETKIPFLENRALYFVVGLKAEDNADAEDFALVEIPSAHVPRFHVLEDAGKPVVIFLDDIIRLCLPEIFKDKNVTSCFAIKISRDAELYIEDEFSGDMLEKVSKHLDKRKTGLPSRFLFDFRMPEHVLKMLMKKLDLNEDDIVPGDRYHNYNDFYSFPNPGNRLPEYEQLVPIPHPALDNASSYFDLLKIKDILVHFPYHGYDDVIRFIEEAANDPDVAGIKITLYRVASNSRVVNALLNALQNGKEVTAFVEIKARFDEQSNIRQVDELKKAGAIVYYNIPGMKVHCKICLVTRLESGAGTHYAYLSTGNFNEKTSKIYTDIGYFTANQAIGADIKKVFDTLAGSNV